MDLKQIEYFVRVAELGSFTRASLALNIAQPALSRQVRMLEVELRQSLLVRNGRGATTTEAGKLLLEHGRGILHQVARAREDLGTVRGGLAGRVAVGMPTSVSKVLTVPLTREFRKRLPDAALSISEGLSVAMQESLIAGRLDIALLYNAVPTPEVEVSPLLQEDLMLVQCAQLGKAVSTATSKGKAVKTTMSPSSKATTLPVITLRELVEIPLIIPTRPNALRTLVDTELHNIGGHLQIALEIDGVAAILDLVADGAGSAVLPKNAVITSANPALFSMRPIKGLRSRLGLAVSAQRPATLTQRAMQEIIRETAAQCFKLT
jgi:LysR family transcriptional regulator, nitrogen assimilation regulatory protein